MSYRSFPYDLQETTPGPPARRYDRTQWFGVFLNVVGATIIGLYWAGRGGWIDPVLGSPTAGFLLLGVGAILVHSRREPYRVMSSAERQRGNWWLFGSLLVGALIVAAVVLIGGT